MPDHELHVVPAARGDHLLRFAHRIGHRFFDDDVLAGIGGRHGFRTMRPVGRDDEDRIDVGVPHQFLHGTERHRDGVFVRFLPCRFDGALLQGHQCRVLCVPDCRRDGMLGEPAEPHDAVPDRPLLPSRHWLSPIRFSSSSPKSKSGFGMSIFSSAGLPASSRQNVANPCCGRVGSRIRQRNVS